MRESNGVNDDQGNGSVATASGLTHVAYAPMDLLAGGNGLPPALSSPPDATGLLRALARKWVVAVVFGVILASGAATLAWFTFPTYYTASALLRIAATEPRLVFQTADPERDFAIYKKTQAELVKSPQVIGAALSHVGEKLSRPENKGVSIPELKSELDPAGWLRRELHVSFPGDAELMQISMSGPNPRAVAMLVNEVKDIYLTEVVASERNERQRRYDKLKEIVDQSEEKLRKDREELRNLTKSLGASESETLAASQHFQMERFTALWQESLKKHMELTETQIELDLANKHLESLANTPVDTTQIESQLNADPMYQSHVQHVRTLQEAVQSMEGKALNPNEPILVRLRDALSRAEAEKEKVRTERSAFWNKRLQDFATAQAKAQVGQLRTKVSLLKENSDQLKAQADLMEKDLKQKETDTVDMEFRRAEIARNDDTTDRIRKSMDAIQIELQAPERIIEMSAASVPKVQDTAKRLPVTVLAGAMAFCCVTALVTWLEYRSRRIGTSAELTNGLQMKVLGALPNLRERASRRLGAPSRARDGYLQWRFTESVHTIRTVLLHAARLDATRVILVTSAVGGEGKTTLTAHLGMSLAAVGKRVLVVDGDTRSPMLHNLFDVPIDPGLSEALAGEPLLSDLIHPTPARNLWVLTAGRHDAQVAPSLSQQVLDEFVGRLRENYDFVLIDSPPVLSVSDALVLGQRSDAAILATMQNVSRLPLVYEAHQRLTALGINVLGAVVNGSTDEYDGLYVQRDRELTMSEA